VGSGYGRGAVQARPEDGGNGDADAADGVWFARQTINNACGTQALLHVVLNAAGGGAFDEHVVHMTAPANLLIVAPVKLSVAVAAAPNADGSVNVTVAADAVALFVTLTTRAAGRAVMVWGACSE
jgi:hypothetical protein